MGLKAWHNLSFLLLAGAAMVGCNNPQKDKSTIAPAPASPGVGNLNPNTAPYPKAIDSKQPFSTSGNQDFNNPNNTNSGFPPLGGNGPPPIGNNVSGLQRTNNSGTGDKLPTFQPLPEPTSNIGPNTVLGAKSPPDRFTPSPIVPPLPPPSNNGTFADQQRYTAPPTQQDIVLPQPDPFKKN